MPKPMDQHAGDQRKETRFSDELQSWLQSEGAKTLGDLGHVFAERSFVVTIMVLMFVPALPAPTGGITHVLEVISMLLAGQMVLGRTTIWLPRRWRGRQIGALTTDRAIPFIVRIIRRFERISKTRGERVLAHSWAGRAEGVVLIGLAVAAFLAPPFSGMDTLPALGAVGVCLGVILADIVVLGIGAALGLGGVLVSLTVGTAVVHWARHLV